MHSTMVPGQVIPIKDPARLRITTTDLADDIRLTAILLVVDGQGRHRVNSESAGDVERHTLKAEFVLEQPEDGDKRMLVIVGTRKGQELPLSQLPAITIVVEDGESLSSWKLASSPNRVTTALEAYRRGNEFKLRAKDEGYQAGWAAFTHRITSDLDLEAVLVKASYPQRRSDVFTAPNALSSVAEADSGMEVQRLQEVVLNLEDRASTLRREYASMKDVYDQLVERVKDLRDMPEWAQFGEVGIYKPHFGYGDSDQYKTAILRSKEQQKQMVAANTAAICSQEWKLGGDRKAGADMIKRQIKLTLRAFNGEADAAISGVRWNNVVAMENRIVRAAESINKANESLLVVVSPKYVDLKVRELRLTHEYRDKVHQEREAAADLRREQREQEKLEREVEKAEREEQKYQMMLDRARAEAAQGDETPALKERLARVEAQLAQAATAAERARAMAELTKCGFVYVISNVGSFGRGIVKIGMTRRLEPMDRIRELSSASVPFAFDHHLLFYSDKASELEASLHRTFADRRVNKANNRKEFFECSIDEVERAVRQIIPGATFTRDPDAREWRETLAGRRQKLVGSDAGFPAAI